MRTAGTRVRASTLECTIIDKKVKIMSFNTQNKSKHIHSMYIGHLYITNNSLKHMSTWERQRYLHEGGQRG